MKVQQNLWLVMAALLLTVTPLACNAQAADDSTGAVMYDETAYTEFVENKMEELDALYLRFCDSCGVDATDAEKAKSSLVSSLHAIKRLTNRGK